MPAGKRRVQPQEGRGDGGATAPKCDKAPEIETCNSLPEGIINPAFDPKRVLLRRVFFFGPEKTKYISIGFYPSRNSQPLVEL